MDEKESIKVSLGTAVAWFMIAVIALALVFSNFYFNKRLDAAEKKLAEKENISVMENTVNEFESTKGKDSYNYIDYTKGEEIQLDYEAEIVKPSNTIRYALLIKYGFNEEVFTKYFSKEIQIGDAVNVDIIECNYGKNIGKYTETIEYDMAVVKDFDYPLDNDKSLSNNLKVFVENLKNENTSKEVYETLNGISFMNGNNANEELYSKYSRAKKIRVTINNDSIYTFDLRDTNEVQLLDINYKQTDIEKPINVKIEVLEKYNGNLYDEVYINEIEFGLSSYGYGGR